MKYFTSMILLPLAHRDGDALTLRWPCLKTKTNEAGREPMRDVTRCCGRVSYEFQHGERRDVGRNGGFRDEMRVRDDSRGGKRRRKRVVGRKTGVRTNKRAPKNEIGSKNEVAAGCERSKTRGKLALFVVVEYRVLLCM